MEKFIDLSDKNIIITGASSGIGKECAILASKLGASVVLIARNKERLDDVYNQLDNGKHLVYSQDITEFDKIPTIIEEVVNKIGKISGLIHSAGIELTLPFKSMKPKYLENMFAINVIAGFEFARIISKKKYIQNESGSFIFISSIMGILGQKGKVGYCTSKSAIFSGCKAMSLELSPKKIRVNSISPGVVNTEMTEKMFDNLTEEGKKKLKKCMAIYLL